MPALLRLLAATLALAAAAHAGAGSYAPLLGNYAGACTVTTASDATGAVTLRITSPGKTPGRALLEIAGSVSPANTVPGTGNTTPLKARLVLQRHRVHASNYLLGLSAARDPSRAARLRGSDETYRFTLASARGTGRLRCTLKLRGAILTLSGTGFTGAAGSVRLPVRILIIAPRA